MKFRYHHESAKDRRDIVVDMISRLADGELMQTTIDTGIVQIGWSHRPAAIARMAGNLQAGQHLSLCLTGYHQARDYLESISDQGRKLMTCCWPGGLQIEAPIDLPFGLFEGLPASVQKRLMSGHRLRLMSPASAFVQELQKLLSGPLVLTSLRSDDKVSASANPEDPKGIPAGCDFLVETGLPVSTQGPTTIELTNDGWQLVQAGILTLKQIRQMTSTFFLFVCTGNTCRSPMAEGLFRKMLADKLQCEVDELADRGYRVGSAGIAAASGFSASSEAVQLLLDDDTDISGHASQQLTDLLIDQSDHILALTNGHRQSILMNRPDVEGKIRLLSPEGRDVSDPIGGGLSEYESCKNEIETYLEQLLKEIE